MANELPKSNEVEAAEAVEQKAPVDASAEIVALRAEFVAAFDELATAVDARIQELETKVGKLDATSNASLETRLSLVEARIRHFV